ncbi:MAG: hypothetical protein KIS76_16170 [Pyrinomonadaceae bacterium]|nr:hypothetical protein [Pyrinomonadaceae bacterium]
MKPIIGLLLITTGLVNFACWNSRIDHYSQPSLNSTSSGLGSDYRVDGVRLDLVSRSRDEVILSLSNDSDSTIYLIYDEIVGETDNHFAVYFLSCQEGGEKTDRTPEWHFVPEHKPLKAREKLKIKLFAIPKFTGECEVSIRYFDNDEPLKLLDKMVSDLPNIRLPTESEAKIIDSTTRIVKTTLNFETDND